MLLNELKPAEGSKRLSKRIGRGHGSGWGKTAGKGHNGQKQRAGASIALNFEGGQMPLIRRIPKRGFTNSAFKKEVLVVNLKEIVDVFEDGEVVNLESLIQYGILKNVKFRNKLSVDEESVYVERHFSSIVKVIGTAEVDKKLTLEVNKISTKAKELVEKANGTVNILPVKGYQRNAKKVASK